jgi:hypothetical protein
MSQHFARLDTERSSLVLVWSGQHVPRLMHWGPLLADDGGEALGEVGLRLPLAWPETIWLHHLERV